MEGYSLFDHLERLRFIDTEVSEEERLLLAKVLETGLPGIEALLQDDRYASLRSKIRYNIIGVFYETGRDDKVIEFCTAHLHSCD